MGWEIKPWFCSPDVWCGGAHGIPGHILLSPGLGKEPHRRARGPLLQEHPWVFWGQGTTSCSSRPTQPVRCWPSPRALFPSRRNVQPLPSPLHHSESCDPSRDPGRAGIGDPGLDPCAAAGSRRATGTRSRGWGGSSTPTCWLRSLPAAARHTEPPQLLLATKGCRWPVASKSPAAASLLLVPAQMLEAVKILINHK